MVIINLFRALIKYIFNFFKFIYEYQKIGVNKVREQFFKLIYEYQKIGVNKVREQFF